MMANEDMVPSQKGGGGATDPQDVHLLVLGPWESVVFHGKQE